MSTKCRNTKYVPVCGYCNLKSVSERLSEAGRLIKKLSRYLDYEIRDFDGDCIECGHSKKPPYHVGCSHELIMERAAAFLKKS